MSQIVSLTDEVRVAELVARAEDGETLGDEELEFLGEFLDRRELDLLEALRPGRRL
jgi:hypothetical protein